MTGMVQPLGDGSLICSECWAREYPDKEAPTYGWVFGECEYCAGFEQD